MSWSLLKAEYTQKCRPFDTDWLARDSVLIAVRELGKKETRRKDSYMHLQQPLCQKQSKDLSPGEWILFKLLYDWLASDLHDFDDNTWRSLFLSEDKAFERQCHISPNPPRGNMKYFFPDIKVNIAPLKQMVLILYRRRYGSV